MEQKTNGNEQRTLGYIEGRLEGLATKSDLAELKLDVSEVISNQTKELGDKIDGVRSRQTRMIGVAVGIGFVLSLLIGAGNLAVNLGWIQTATG